MASLGFVFLLLAVLGISSDARGISGPRDDAGSIRVPPARSELGHDASALDVRTANQDDQEVDKGNEKAFRTSRRPRAANQNRDEETQRLQSNELGADLHRNSRSLAAGNVLSARENDLVDLGVIDKERVHRFLWISSDHGHGFLEGNMGLKMVDEDEDARPRMRPQGDRKRPKGRQGPGKKPEFSRRENTDKSDAVSRQLDGTHDLAYRAKRHAPSTESQHPHWQSHDHDHDHVSCFHRRRQRSTTTTTTTSSPKDAETVDKDVEEIFEDEEEDNLVAIVKNRTTRSTFQKGCYPTRNVSPPRTTQRRQQGGGSADKVDAIKMIVAEILTTIRATAGAILASGGALGGGGAPGGGGALGSGGTGGAGAGAAGGGASPGGSTGGAGGAAGGGAGSAGGTGGGGAGSGGGSVGTPTRSRNRGRRATGEWAGVSSRLTRSADDDEDRGEARGRDGRRGGDEEDVGRGGGVREGPRDRGQGTWSPREQDHDDERGGRDWIRGMGEGPGDRGQGPLDPRGPEHDNERGDRNRTMDRRESRRRSGRKPEMVNQEELDRNWSRKNDGGKDGFFKRMWKKAKSILGIGKNKNTEVGNDKNFTGMGEEGMNVTLRAKRGVSDMFNKVKEKVLEKVNATFSGLGATRSVQQSEEAILSTQVDGDTDVTARNKRGVSDMFNKVKDKVMEKVNMTVSGLGATRSVHQSGEAIFLTRIGVNQDISACAIGAEQADREVNDAEENNRENSNTFSEPGGIDTGLRQKRRAAEQGDKIQGWLQSAMSGKLGADDQNQRKSEDNKGLTEILKKISDLARNASESAVGAAGKVGLELAEIARGMATNVTEKMSGKRRRKSEKRD